VWYPSEFIRSESKPELKLLHPIVKQQEELQDLGSCFSNVRINNNVKGGLHWMAGTSSSTSGRFKVVACHHELLTYVIGGGLKWRFQKRNRGEFKAASGRVTYEVTVNPAVFSLFRKASAKP
jgi:hypothetical protein